MLITCDYLEIYLKGYFLVGENKAGKHNTDNFQFGKYEHGTQMYFERWYVAYQGVHFGTLLCRPRMKTLPPDACHFKLENEQLYINGANSVLVHFLQETGLKFHSVTRLDIACDFHSFAHGYTPQQFVLDYLSGAIDRVGKGLAKFAPHYTTVQGRSVLTGLAFGSRTAERHGRLYNKTLELEKSNKPYISAWHEMNGLVGADIWRLEFTLRGRELKKLFRPSALTVTNKDGGANTDVSVRRVMHNEYQLLAADILSGIFQTELRSYFSFVKGGSVGEKSKRKRIVLLDFLGFNPKPELIMRIPIKRSATQKTDRYKRAVKTLIQDYYLTKEATYLHVAFQFINKYNLHALVRKRFDYWLKEFAPYVDERYQYVDILDMLGDVERAS